ncbi:hypothetical protein MAPG_03147 [Magnaporthiopsis poae ATCC 64411]|uniref:Uncharacterized protein n=1 Tax=Magnaporthiopsis poae (strain ATCC 64411 / 73-15) TaxID=644358 RepID=A0A0C4DT87_MAGP6|nr:hypothetical protein MAPG_03147 [Magnaporthiopsis poae ATCC 64411]
MGSGSARIDRVQQAQVRRAAPQGSKSEQDWHQLPQLSKDQGDDGGWSMTFSAAPTLQRPIRNPSSISGLDTTARTQAEEDPLQLEVTVTVVSAACVAAPPNSRGDGRPHWRRLGDYESAQSRPIKYHGYQTRKKQQNQGGPTGKARRCADLCYPQLPPTGPIAR